MSQDITATLLPASKVDFYVLDNGTEAAAALFTGDWRFARVSMQVTRGGIDAAIATYSQYASPDVLIVETDDISENFITQLGQLANVCSPETDAVIVGPMNDVHLYRSLVGMGVRDYLVRPVTQEDLVKVIAKAIIDKRGLSGARLVTVSGAKGGVGCTTIAQILAWSISDACRQKTMLMDAAGSPGSLGIAYGIEPATTFAEAVRIGLGGTDDDMKRIVQSAGDQLSLLVCGGEPMLTESPDAESFEALVNRIMQKYPVVVLDLSGSSPAVHKRMVVRANSVVVVSTAMLPSLRNSRTLLNDIKNMRAGLKDIDVVINMIGIAQSEEVAAKDIKTALDLEPIAKIPFAPKIFGGGEASGKPVGQNKAAADIMKQIETLARRVAVANPTAKETDDGSGGKKDSPLGFLKKITGK
jgi:pilus assembly protein CpaE